MSRVQAERTAHRRSLIAIIVVAIVLTFSAFVGLIVTRSPLMYLLIVQCMAMLKWAPGRLRS
jgi:hypothetical protein